MNLDQYLSAEGSLTPAQLRERIGVKSDTQIRQWRHGYARRKPSPAMAMSIERATDGRVPRWDTRPGDWHLIWPELIGAKGAPAIPSEQKAA